MIRQWLTGLFGIGAILSLLSGCDLETQRMADALGPGRDVIRMHRLYPTGWVTDYNVALPGPKLYFSRGGYELPSPFTPGRIQGVLKNLSAWTTEAHNLLVSLMNHDPLFTYQMGPLQTQIAFKTTLQAPKTRETLTVLSDATVGGQILYVDPRGQMLPFYFQMTVPESRTTLANPFVIVPPNTAEATPGPTSSLKEIHVPSAQFFMYSSEAWKNAASHLSEPGFKLSGDVSVEGQGQGFQVVARALSLLSTLRLAGVNHHLQFHSEPGLTYHLSRAGVSGLQQAQVMFTHQAEGSIDLDKTDYRLDQVRLRVGHILRRPPSFLSKMGLAGSLIHKPTGSAMSLDIQNLLWMKKDPVSGQVFKSRHLLSGSLRGKIPRWAGGPTELQPWLNIDSFEIYLDGGDRLQRGLPEAIHVLVHLKGARVEFGEARIAPDGKALWPLTISVRARALLRLNLAQQTFWSRDNTLMVSVDYLGFEGDGQQLSLQMDPGLKREASGSGFALHAQGARRMPGGQPLSAVLEDYIRRDQTEHIMMISPEALNRLNQEGEVPPIVAELREQFSSIRIEKFDEQQWQFIFDRAQGLERDFDVSSQVAE